jgi:tripartite-type tricarboxylate transporter receptor subunit TctC
MGQKLSEQMGQPFVVDNKPGAGGALAADIVAKAPADGYTLLVADMGQLAINPLLNAKLPYQPLRDFQPISPVVLVPQFLAVSTSSPITSVKTLIEHVKKNPGFSYATPGVGTSHHLEVEALRARAGLNMLHVPYKGGAQTIPALISGEVGMTISAMGALQPQVKAGKIRIIGVTTLKSSPIAPEVAPISAVLPGYDLSDSVGFLAPARTPSAVVDRINREIVTAGKSPAVVKRLAELGLEAKVSSPPEYTYMIRQASEKFGKVIKDLGITAE